MQIAIEPFTNISALFTIALQIGKNTIEFHTNVQMKIAGYMNNILYNFREKI